MSSFTINLSGELSLFDNATLSTDATKALASSLGITSTVFQGSGVATFAGTTLPTLSGVADGAFFLYLKNLTSSVVIEVAMTINGVADALQYPLLPGGVIILQNTALSVPYQGLYTGVTSVVLTTTISGVTGLFEYALGG